MDRIYLTKAEKDLLQKLIHSRSVSRPSDKEEAKKYSYAAVKLRNKGFVTTDTDLFGVTETHLSIDGKVYIDQNPKLRNPFPWEFIAQAASVIAAVAASLALVVGCCRLFA